MTDTLYRFTPNPCTISLNILRKSGCSRPSSYKFEILAFFALKLWPNRSTPGKLWRDFNHGLVDENCHRIQIRGIGLESKSLCFKRNNTPSCKGIMESRKLVRIKKFGCLRMLFIKLAYFTP